MSTAPPPTGRETASPAAGSAHAQVSPREPWGWNRRQRRGLGILLGLLLICLTIQWVRRPYRLDDHAVVIDGEPVTLPERSDPNTASAEELARIPHLGDALAARIVQYRDARTSTAADGVVFRRPADLDPIPGLGPKLIDQLSPYLRFPEDAP
jgi:hypothetical protein